MIREKWYFQQAEYHINEYEENKSNDEFKNLRMEFQL